MWVLYVTKYETGKVADTVVAEESNWVYPFVHIDVLNSDPINREISLVVMIYNIGTISKIPPNTHVAARCHLAGEICCFVHLNELTGSG